MRHRLILRRSFVLAATLSLAAEVIAQLQVDNRVNPQLNPAGTVQNYQPNDYSVGTSIYYRTPHQFELLPSEALMAAQRSGALPSELLMGAQQAGPLNPYGAISYIPNESPLQRAMRLPPPQLYNPAYHISPALGQPSLSSPAGAGSINYGPTLRSPLYGPWPSNATTPQPTRTFLMSTTLPSARIESPGSASPDYQPAATQTDLTHGSIYFSSINPPCATQPAR